MAASAASVVRLIVAGRVIGDGFGMRRVMPGRVILTAHARAVVISHVVGGRVILTDHARGPGAAVVVGHVVGGRIVRSWSGRRGRCGGPGVVAGRIIVPSIGGRPAGLGGRVGVAPLTMAVAVSG